MVAKRPGSGRARYDPGIGRSHGGVDHRAWRPALHQPITLMARSPAKRVTSTRRHSAFCLETQHFPDSVNQPQFPLRHSSPRRRLYRQTTVHKFSTTITLEINPPMTLKELGNQVARISTPLRSPTAMDRRRPWPRQRHRRAHRLQRRLCVPHGHRAIHGDRRRPRRTALRAKSSSARTVNDTPATIDLNQPLKPAPKGDLVSIILWV